MMSWLSPRLRVPVMLSVGLHGILVLAIGALAWNAGDPDRSRWLVVELVAGSPKPTPALPQLTRAASSPVRHPRVHHPVAPSARVAAKTRPLPSRLSVPQPLPAAKFESESAKPTLASPAPSYSPQPAEIPQLVAQSPAPAEDVITGYSSVPAASDAAQASLLVLANMAPMPLERRWMVSESERVRLLRDPVAEAGAALRSVARAADNVRPEYPRAAREAGWEGMVLLRVEVLPEGRAGTVTLHRSSGHTILDDAALSAVRRWRFIPAMDGNFPVRSVVHLPIRFDLRAIN